MFTEKQEKEIVELTISFCTETFRKKLENSLERHQEAQHWIALSIVAWIANNSDAIISNAVAIAAVCGVSVDVLYAALKSIKTEEIKRIESVVVGYGWSESMHYLEEELELSKLYGDKSKERQLLTLKAAMHGLLPRQNGY